MLAGAAWKGPGRHHDDSPPPRFTKRISPQLRSLVLAAAILLTVFLLSRSFNVGTREIEQTTRQSLHVINKLAPAAWRGQQSQVTKVTALFGQENELYEAAIRSHDEHDRLHGYGMKVLRERIVNNYWSKPAYLLSLIVEELAKPVEERTGWVMWLGPDIILLNSHIPLEIFLPPAGFEHIHFLGTHDTDGLNTGAFFLRVHEWSARMLVEVLAMPANTPALEHAPDKDKMAMELVLTDTAWRKEVLYQPRTWYNAYQLDVDHFEGKRGDLLVHFHALEGDKWSAMSRYLTQVALRNSTWNVPLGMTTYESEVHEYWDRIRQAEALLDVAELRIADAGVEVAAKRLGYAYHFEADIEQVMHEAMDALKEALGILEGQKVV
ncbi:hypothetical protein LTR08_006411 [Meristemomyces frigidus]|nr:hypothetical protein LTR08_006411 [Meristemomyces frigidus]